MSNELLEDHMRIVHEGITYKCDFCFGKYNSRMGLKHHLATHHPEQVTNI